MHDKAGGDHHSNKSTQQTCCAILSIVAIHVVILVVTGADKTRAIRPSSRRWGGAEYQSYLRLSASGRTSTH